MPATTTTKKKTTTRAKKISLEEAEKQKEEAIAKAKEEAREEERKRMEAERIKTEMNTPDDHDFDEEYDDEDGPTFGVQGGAYYEDTDLPQEPDIFEFGRQLEDQGRDISYYIKKDNAFLVELFTATTMEELKKKYGGGKYQIAIKNGQGQWIKQKTIRIHGPIEPEEKEDKQPYFPPQPQMPQIDLNQTFGAMSQMFMQMQEMSQREKSRADRDEKKSSESFNTTLFQVISEQGKSTQQMIMEMQRNNMEMLKAMSENTARSLEKAEERNREMIREIKASSSKKEEFGLKDALALVATSRNDGIETMKMVMDLSENMADLRTPPAVETDSKEGMMGKLVSAVVPLLNRANQQATAAAQVPGVAQIPQQTPGVQQRRMVQHPQVRQTQNPQQAPIPQGHHGNRAPQGQGQARPGSPIKGNGVYQETRVQNFPQSPLSSLGLPSFADKGGNVPTMTKPEGKVTPHEVLGEGYESSEEFIERTMKDLNQNPEPLSKTGGKETMSDEAKASIEDFKALMPFVRESDLFKNASKAQQNIVELGLPIIAQYVNDETVTPEIVAHFVIDECANQGFGAKVLAKEFTFDFLLQIASNFGIGEEKKPWFGEFYETIQDAAGETTLGEEEPSIS